MDTTLLLERAFWNLFKFRATYAGAGTRSRDSERALALSCDP
jgi:hypothetical protein